MEVRAQAIPIGNLPKCACCCTGLKERYLDLRQKSVKARSHASLGWG